MRHPRLRMVPGLIVLMAAVLAPRAAYAHKLIAYADPYGTEVEGGAAFSSGDPATGAKVTVYGPDGKVVLETKTDDAGEFTFKAPYRCDYRVVVDAGEGHRAEAVAPGDDLDASLPAYGDAPVANAAPGGDASGKAAGEPADADASTGATPYEAGEAPDRDAATADAEAIREIVDEAVKRRVKPLKQRIDRLAGEMRFRDVLGGVGFILGVFGVAAYLLAGRRKGDT